MDKQNNMSSAAPRFSTKKSIHTKGSDNWDTPQILSPPITIALAILAGGVGSLLVWSVVYELPITASGTGLIYQAPRLIGVKAAGSGLLKSLYVKVGSSVEQGSVLAELDVKDQELMVSEATRQTELAGQDRKVASESIPSELAEQILANQKLLTDIGRNITQQQNILAAQTKNLSAYKQLESKGYLSSVELMSYQEKAVELQNSIGQTRSQYNKLLAERENTKRQLASALNETRSRFVSAEATQRVRQHKLLLAHNLRSPIKGQVSQITSWPGNTVTEGQEMFVISPSHGLLTAGFLISSSDAGRIKVGDPALLSPASAPPQRYGYLKGVVSGITPYPTTQAAYASLIGSETLAKQVFDSQQAKLPLLVMVNITYHQGKLVWSGSKGPTWPITSGSLADVKVIYYSRKPITYVIPWLRQITGVSNF
jgi:HlyD family secretion protein